MQVTINKELIHGVSKTTETLVTLSGGSSGTIVTANVDIVNRGDAVKKYELQVYNGSTYFDTVCDVYNKSIQGTPPVYSFLESVTFNACQVVRGSTVKMNSKFIENMLNGCDCRLAFSNSALTNTSNANLYMTLKEV